MLELSLIDPTTLAQSWRDWWRQVKEWLWSFSGRAVGYRDGDDLWTFAGHHRGRFVGDEVYDARGFYLGEVALGRLLTNITKVTRTTAAFEPGAIRRGQSKPADYTAYDFPEGYEDFPRVER